MSSDGFGGCILEHTACDGVTSIQAPLFAMNNMLVIINVIIILCT